MMMNVSLCCCSVRSFTTRISVKLKKLSEKLAKKDPLKNYEISENLSQADTFLLASRRLVKPYYSIHI
jgi:hypothetical protein